MDRLFNNTFGFVRHAEYVYDTDNYADRSAPQKITDTGEQQCKVLAQHLKNFFTGKYEKLIFVHSPKKRAEFTAKLVASHLNDEFSITLHEAVWLDENKQQITQRNIESWLENDVFVIFFSHWPDMSTYFKTHDISHCDLLSNVLRVARGKVIETTINEFSLDNKLNLLHNLFAGDFETSEFDISMLNAYGVENLDILKACEIYSKEFNTELSRIRDLLLNDL